MTPQVILAGAGAGAVALLAVAAAVLTQDSRNRRLGLRIAERVTPLAPARAPARPLSEQLGLPALVASCAASSSIARRRIRCASRCCCCWPGCRPW